MCMGSPKPPQIVQQGPSREQVQLQQQQLAAYQQAMNQQASDFRAQLQAQVDAVNQQTAQMQQAAATPPAVVDGGYQVATTQADPVNAQTTETLGDMQARRSSLRITPGATASAAGIGLNIGV